MAKTRLMVLGIESSRFDGCLGHKIRRVWMEMGGGRVTLDFFGMSSWAHFGGTQWAEGLCLRKYPALEDGLSVT